MSFWYLKNSYDKRLNKIHSLFSFCVFIIEPKLTKTYKNSFMLSNLVQRDNIPHDMNEMIIDFACKEKNCCQI